MLAVKIGGALGGVVGTVGFQRVAELQQVALGFRAAFEQGQQRVAEAVTELIADIISAALTADQQALGDQLLHRFA